jgi:hypothetical protein
MFRGSDSCDPRAYRITMVPGPRSGFVSASPPGERPAAAVDGGALRRPIGLTHDTCARLPATLQRVHRTTLSRVAMGNLAMASSWVGNLGD